MLYGGGSIKKNGIYKQVKNALKSFEVIEFIGIPANHEYEILIDALKIIKEEKITYMLASNDAANNSLGEKPVSFPPISIVLSESKIFPAGDLILTL